MSVDGSRPGVIQGCQSNALAGSNPRSSTDKGLYQVKGV